MSCAVTSQWAYHIRFMYKYVDMYLSERVFEKTGHFFSQTPHPRIWGHQQQCGRGAPAETTLSERNISRWEKTARQRCFSLCVCERACVLVSHFKHSNRTNREKTTDRQGARKYINVEGKLRQRGKVRENTRGAMGITKTNRDAELLLKGLWWR